MHKKILEHITHLLAHPKRNKNKFLYFLVTLVLLITYVPFAEMGIYHTAILNLLTTVFILTGVYAVSETSSHIFIASMLGVPWFLINWINLFIHHDSSGLGALSWGVLFFSYTTALVFINIIRGTRVDIETLYGAVTVYLLIGITYASIYILIENVYPGSFNMISNQGHEYPFQMHDLLYYSFVTLTTLGYGDITSVRASARILSVSEAVIGQLYLTILVARLVGLHISSISKNR